MHISMLSPNYFVGWIKYQKIQVIFKTTQKDADSKIYIQGAFLTTSVMVLPDSN